MKCKELVLFVNKAFTLHLCNKNVWIGLEFVTETNKLTKKKKKVLSTLLLLLRVERKNVTSSYKS